MGPTHAVAPDFVVATGANVLSVGANSHLSVTAYTRSSEPNAYVNGVQQSVDVSSAASFSSADPSIASIVGATVSARGAGATSITATYMGRSYAIPIYVVASSPAVSAFAGTWSGTTTFSCQDVVGDTRSCYGSSGQPVVFTTNVVLSLTESAGVLYGTIDIGGGSVGHIIGQVVAGLNDTGELVVGGTPCLSAEHQLCEQLLGLRFTLSNGHMTGNGQSDTAFVNIYGPVLERKTYASLDLR